MESYLIGNTPMIKINYEYQGQRKSVYTKLEYYNLTGSIKDRMALNIIENAKKRGELKEGMPIVEATSGNTGISLSAIGSLYHHCVHIFMPDWISKERINIMEMYGAKVHLVSREDGGFRYAIQKANDFARELKGYCPNQFSNLDNVEAHYHGTAKELLKQLDRIDGFVSGIGTGGTLMGIAKRLREENKTIVICALEPDSLPILTTGNDQGTHKIEGIGDDFIPSIIDKKMIDKILLINDKDAINMSAHLARDLGLGVGISSGANMIAAVLLHEKIDGNIVTLFPDDNKKYLSTELSKGIVENSNYISNQIKLINYEIINNK